MYRHVAFLSAATTLAIAFLSGACGLANNDGGGSATEPPANRDTELVGTTSLSFAHTYADVAELTAFSDAVVHVRVNEDVETERAGRKVMTQFPVEVLGAGKGAVERGDQLTVRTERRSSRGRRSAGGE